ncbi:MAG: hypothetical protein GY854_25710 [Deltaproteobacteria bacterium]|nr:hypothetical protein [Deltaproteobacteria bacterium]
MKSNKVRDIVLLTVVVALGVLALLPTGKRSESEGTTTDAMDDEGVPENAIQNRKPNVGVGIAADPILNVAHEYLPLIPGSTWVYKVRGPKALVPEDTWTIKLLTAPNGENPGKIEAGFGDNLHAASVWLDGESLRFDGLSFIAPMEFFRNHPNKISGEFLPAAARIGEDAVWIYDLERDVIHEFRDKRGKVQKVPAQAKQRERAHVRGFENITTSVGMYRACSVKWISRIEVFVKGRPVLQNLTAEPFRNETMWLVPGIGIVQRRIEYPGFRTGQISLDLIRYDRPEPTPVKGQPKRSNEE